MLWEWLRQVRPRNFLKKRAIISHPNTVHWQPSRRELWVVFAICYLNMGPRAWPKSWPRLWRWLPATPSMRRQRIVSSEIRNGLNYGPTAGQCSFLMKVLNERLRLRANSLYKRIYWPHFTSWSRPKKQRYKLEKAEKRRLWLLMIVFIKEISRPKLSAEHVSTVVYSPWRI